MDSNRVVRVVAGAFVTVSLALGVEAEWNPLFLSRYWLGFTAFVGLNLFQSGLTNWCLMERILWKLGVKKPGEEGAPSAASQPARVGG